MGGRERTMVSEPLGCRLDSEPSAMKRAQSDTPRLARHITIEVLHIKKKILECHSLCETCPKKLKYPLSLAADSQAGFKE